MLSNILNSWWFMVANHTIATVASFLAALILSSATRMNTGAKANRAWYVTAIGFTFVGFSEGSLLAAELGFPVLHEWDGIFVCVGMLLILTGAILWRAIVKKAVS